MKAIEQLELDAYRGEMSTDMHDLVERYRRIFCLDIPDIDQRATDALIIAAMHTALDDIAKKLAV